MIPIFLCDDEPFWTMQLEKAIFDYQVSSDWELEPAYKFTSPQKLLEYIQEHRPTNGIYFLDILFPAEMNGLELAVEIRKLDPNATFVFITTQEEMVMETFRLKLEALDYIIKDSTNWLENVTSCMIHLEKRYRNSTSPYKDAITLKSDNYYKTFLLQDIYCIEAVYRTHRIYIHTQNEMISIICTLSSVEEMLNEDFHKCSKTCVINLHHVSEWLHKEKKIKLNNGLIRDCSIREWKRLMKLLKTEADQNHITFS